MPRTKKNVAADGGTDVEALQAELAALRAAYVEVATANKNIIRDQDVVESGPNKTPVVQVERTGGPALSFTLMDRFGNNKSFRMAQLGDILWLTLDQVEELKEKVPAWISKGFLSIKGEAYNKDNIVRSLAELLKLPTDEIPGRIEKITEPSVLMRIYFELDSSRFTTEEDGKPIVGEDGKPVARERIMTAVEQVLFHSVASRLQTLTGQVVQLSDG